MRVKDCCARAAAWARGHGRQLIALLFALLLLAGALGVRHAAPGADDGTERRTLAVNIRAYAERFGLLDAPFFSALPEERLEEYRDRDYGQARYYPIWPVMNAFELRGQPGGSSTALYLYNHLLFLLGLFGLYAMLHRLTGSRGAGAVGLLLLYLNPRFWAESFYNTKDLALLSLCLVTLWLGLRFAQEKSWASCVWFGLAGAVVTNERLIGLCFFGLMGLVYLARLTLGRQWSARAFWRGAAAVGSLAAFWYLLTPAAWSGPLGFLRYQLGQTSNFDTLRWGSWLLYRGAVYNPVENPIPWHYIPWYLLITTPLLVLALAAAWPVLLVCKNGRDPARWRSDETLVSAAAALLTAVPVLYAMLRRPNLYNGWRHLYFVYAGIVLFASLAAARLWVLARGLRLPRRRVFAGALAGVLAVQFAYYGGFLLHNGQNSFAYFNLLAGPHPEQRYDADYWNIGMRTLMEEMQKRDPVLSVVPVNRNTNANWTWYKVADLLPPMAEGSEEVSWDRRWRARYVVENVSYSAINALHPVWDLTDPEVIQWEAQMADQQPVYELYCGRTLLWRVYQNPQYNGPDPDTRIPPPGG